MVYLVCCDISDDKARYRLSKRLLDFGARIQESVFECLLDETLFERMMKALDKIELDELDKIRIYKVCANCIESVRIYGSGKVLREADFYVV